jgi:uncharacterized membrane protein YgcG
LLDTFAQKANIEIKTRSQTLAKQIEDRAKLMERRYKEQKRKEESDARNRAMESIRKLSQLRHTSTKFQREAIDLALQDIDTVARSISARGIEDMQELIRLYNEQAEEEGYDANNPEKKTSFLANESAKAALERLQNVQIDSLTIDEVRELGIAVNSITNAIKNSRFLLVGEQMREVKSAAKKVNSEIKNAKGSRNTGIIQWYINGTLSGSRYLHRLAGWAPGQMAQLSDNLEAGQQRMMEHQRRAARVFDQFFENEDNRKWLETAQGKHAKWSELHGTAAKEGNKPITVEITPMMRLSIYMHTLNKDNLWHLLNGGLKVPNKRLYLKGDMKEAVTKGTAIKLTRGEIRDVVNSMSKTEKEFARYLAAYYSEVSAPAINEVSTATLGYERATLNNYYHIKVDPEFHGDLSKIEQEELNANKYAFIESSRTHSPLRIVLEDATDALEEHIIKTSKYYGYTMPVRDLNAVLNKTIFDENGGAIGTALGTIDEKWGGKAEKYIKDLVTDLQSRDMKTDDLSNLFVKLRGNYARAVIAANPSSTLKQIGSYPVALPYLGTDALVHGLQPRSMKNSVQILEQYSPVYWYRNRGNTTMEISEAAARNREAFAEKLPLGYRWTQWMDSAVTRRLLAAVEYKVQHEMGLQPGTAQQIADGTDRYWREVAKLFADVVLKTQSNTSIMERAGFTRANPANVSRFLTMFRTDAFQQFNMLTEAFGRLNYAKTQYKGNDSDVNKAALSKARAFAAKTVTGTMVGQSYVALVAALIKFLKKKDDEYKDEEGNFSTSKFLSAVGWNIIEGYAGFLLGADLLWEAVEAKLRGNNFYGLEVNAVELVNDVLDAAIVIGDKLSDADWRGGIGAIKDAALVFSKALGIPAENIETYLLLTTKWIAPEWAAKYENLWGEITKSDLKGKSKRDRVAAIQVLFDNRMEGISDDEAAELDRLYSAGFTEVVPSGIPKAFSYSEEEGEDVTVEMSGAQRDEYREQWGKIVSAALPDMLASEAFADADDEEKAAMVGRLYSYAGQIAKHKVSEGFEPDKWITDGEEAAEDGISRADYIIYRTLLSEVNGKLDGTTVTGLKDRRTLDLISSMGWSDEQEKTVYLDTASESNQEKVDALMKAGLNWTQASDVLTADGSKWEKMNKIIELPNVSDKKKIDVLAVYASEKELSLIRIGVKFGLSLQDYAAVRNKADKNKNGQISQEEAAQYIPTLGLSIQDSAYLWQMITDGKSGKNNPFSTFFGEDFWNAAHPDGGGQDEDEQEESGSGSIFGGGSSSGGSIFGGGSSSGGSIFGDGSSSGGSIFG